MATEKFNPSSAMLIEGEVAIDAEKNMNRLFGVMLRVKRVEGPNINNNWTLNFGKFTC